MEKRLDGKVILVTGGSRGIGESIVRRLCSEGAIVFSTYNSNSDRAQSIRDEIALDSGSVTFHKVNVTIQSEIQSWVDQIISSTGRIDGLVNNAGVTKDGLLMRMSESDWDTVIDTNLKSVFFLTKAVMRQMMSQRNGRIVNISSVVGIIGNAGQANYVASKSGLIGFTKSIAKELASRNILVNCVAPGYIETEMTEKLTQEQRSSFLEIIPLKRQGTGNDVAATVSFFMSDDSSYITGQTLTVDGGMVM